MEYRSLGRTGMKVSALCLGAGKFGGAAPEADCARIIDRAIDAGINFIDTAYVYGDSEAIIGRALKASGRRSEVLIATKIQPMANDRRTITDQCHESLRRLRTDVIDLLMLHRPNPDIPIDESLRALDDLVRAGKVRYLGTSSFKAWQILEALQVSRELGLNRFVSEQSVYSLLARGIETEVIPMCRTYGVGLMLWSPLGAGVLTDRYSRENPPKHVELSEREWRVVETVQAIARGKGCTASQLAFAWLLRRPGVTCPIAGVRTVEQIDDNLGALEVEVTDEDCAALDAVSPPAWTARQGWLGLEFGKPHTHRL